MINDDDMNSWAYLLSPTFQFVNTSGKPLTEGWMEVYIHGTRNKYYCASDFNGTLHPFQIPLDSLGANIVLASPDNAYDVYVYNKFGSLIMSRYNVSPVGAGGGSSTLNIVIESDDGTVTVVSDGTGNFDLSIADTVNRVNNIEEILNEITGYSAYSVVHAVAVSGEFQLTDDGSRDIPFTTDLHGWKLESGHIYQLNFNTILETGVNNRYVSGKVYLEGPSTINQSWNFNVDDSYIHTQSINGSTIIVAPAGLEYYELKLKYQFDEEYESAPIVSLGKASIVDITSLVNSAASGASSYQAGYGIEIDSNNIISVDSDVIASISGVSAMIDEAIAEIQDPATATLTVRTPDNKDGTYTTLGTYEPTGTNKTITVPKEVYTFIINSSNTYYNDVIQAYLNNKEVIAIEIESWYVSGEPHQNVYQNFAQKQYWGYPNFYNNGYVNFTRFDVDKNELVTWKCEPQTPGSTGGVAKWTKTVTELGTGGLFVAEYNVTPYADIDAAFKSGKTVIVKRRESLTSNVTDYYQLCEYREYEQDPSFNSYYFSYLYGWYSEYVYCFPSNWGRSTFNLATWEHVNNVVADAVSGLATEEYVDNAIASAASGLKEICYIDYPTTPVSAITEAINNNQYPILKLGYDYIPLTVIGGNYYGFTGIIGGGQSGAGGYSVTANTDTNTWSTPQAINFATNEWTTELVSTVSGNIINTVSTVSGDIINTIETVSGDIITIVENVSGDLHEEIVSAINVVTSNIPEQVQSDWTESATGNPAYIKNKPEELEIVAGNNISISVSGNEMTISAADVDTSSFATHSEVNTVSGVLEGQIQTVSGSIPSLNGYATENWVQQQGYLTSVPSEYATDSEVSAAIATATNDMATQTWVNNQDYATNTDLQIVSGSIPSLNGYATEQWVENKDYATNTDLQVVSAAIPSLNGYATESDVYNATVTAINAATSQIPDISGLATKQEVNSVSGTLEGHIQSVSGTLESEIQTVSGAIPSIAGLASETYVDNKVVSAINVATGMIPDVSEFATETEVYNASITAIQTATAAIPQQVNADWNSNSGVSEILNKPDLSVYATNTDLQTVSAAIPDVSNLATETYVDDSVVSAINVATGAIPAQVQSNWTETSTSSPAYIQNKPVEKQLVAGTNISITVSGNDVIINSTGAASGNYVTEYTLNTVSGVLEGHIQTVSAAIPDVSSFATKQEVQDVESDVQIVSAAIPSIAGLASESYVDTRISAATGMIPDTSDMATQTWVGQQGYLTSIPSEYTTESEVYNATVTAIQTATANVPAQVQSNWTEDDTADPSYIQNKPDLSVYTTINTVSAMIVSAVSGIEDGNCVIVNYGETNYNIVREALSNNKQVFVRNEPATNVVWYAQLFSGNLDGGSFIFTGIDNNYNVVRETLFNSTGGGWWQTGSEPLQSNWNETNIYKPSYIQNKPTEKNLVAGNNINITVSGSDVIISSTASGGGGSGVTYQAGDHIDITNDTISVTGITELVAGNAITITTTGASAVISSTGEAQVQSDWDETNSSSKAYIRNKPSIPAAQVQSDWNQTYSWEVDYIKNKPTIPNYSGASGISISNDVVSLDNPIGLVAGSGINIVVDGDSAIICATVTGGGGSVTGNYQAGYGIDITGDTISVDTVEIATINVVCAVSSTIQAEIGNVETLLHNL